MKREDQAVELFQRNFTCSQAVFVPFCQPAALSETDALKISTAFGGGTCGTGKGICGAANGALLAISLRCGMTDPAALEDKAKTYELGQRFLTRFREKMGGGSCEEILGVNVSTPEYKLDQQRAQQLRASRCTDAVREASRILETLVPDG